MMIGGFSSVSALDTTNPFSRLKHLLQEAGLQPTTRLKTVNTIVDKLRRHRTRLSTMQDVAGARIVRDMSLDEQDALVATVHGAFVQARVG